MILVQIYYHGCNISNNSDTACLCQQQNAETSAMQYHQITVNSESGTYGNTRNNNRSVQRILLMSTKQNSKSRFATRSLQTPCKLLF